MQETLAGAEGRGRWGQGWVVSGHQVGLRLTSQGTGVTVVLVVLYVGIKGVRVPEWPSLLFFTVSSFRIAGSTVLPVPASSQTIRIAQVSR